jgi:hypothetical protein
MAAVKRYKHLVVTRLFLGVAEAGLLPDSQQALFMSWNYHWLNALKAAQIEESKGKMDVFADMGDMSLHCRWVSS